MPSSPQEDHHRAVDADIRKLPPDWKRPSGRPSHTWLRAVETDWILASHLPGGRQLFVKTVDALWTQQCSSGVCYERRKQRCVPQEIGSHWQGTVRHDETQTTAHTVYCCPLTWRATYYDTASTYSGRGCCQLTDNLRLLDVDDNHARTKRFVINLLADYRPKMKRYVKGIHCLCYFSLITTVPSAFYRFML